MSLSPEAFDRGLHNQGPRCSIELLLAALPAGDRDVLVSALGDPTVAHATIARVLKAEGHQVSRCVIGNHRRGDCRCGG